MSTVFIETGSTNVRVEVFIRSSTTGQGLTGLAHGDVEINYSIDGGAALAVLEVASIYPLWIDWGWREIDATNKAGAYTIDVPSTLYASQQRVVMTVTATGAIDKVVTIEAGTIASDTEVATAVWADANSTTLANQTTIINAIQDGVVTRIPRSNETLDLINHGSYDGTHHPLITFPVTKDYTAFDSVTLVFFNEAAPATKYKEAAGVVVSATSITVDVNVDFGAQLEFSGCPQVATCAWTLVGKTGTDEEEISGGTAYVENRAQPA